MSLKERIKAHAYALGADLVGFGDIGRCRHAPLMMSPQGLYPEAQSIVVMALHHPDACVELGGERHPQEIGPYSVQYLMNSRLDELSYRMATFIEDLGYGAVPVASSNIWRYNAYKDLKAVFAPDISHIYMAVVAGLADMGYSGLALTPEFGARNRFVTVVTDLALEPDPLIPPGTVCDQCMLCRKHCPSAALSKEIDGDKILKIDDYEYRFANKNLWRCAWGEHFDLDLDLDIPERVTEAVIVEKVKEHGIRGGEMGQCLKFCVPRNLRAFDRAYSRTPMRRHAVTLDEDLESRALADRLLADAYAADIDHVAVTDASTLAAAGIDLEKNLPGARCALTLLRRVPEASGAPADAEARDAFRGAAAYHVDSVAYDLTRALEGYGFRSLMTIERGVPRPGDETGPAAVNARVAAFLTDGHDGEWVVNTVLTRKRLPARAFRPEAEDAQPAARWTRADDPSALAARVKAYARAVGADLAGVASAERIETLAAQLRLVYAGETSLEARDRSIRFTRWDPEVTERAVAVRTAADHLPGARAVLVMGFRLHEQVLAQATKPPAEAVGPYAFETYVTQWQAGLAASKMVGLLRRLGYRAAMSFDTMGLGGFVANPRGRIEDGFANRFAAVAAGLAGLTEAGRAFTKTFGIRQRFVAVVTDAPLAPDALADLPAERCAGCAEPCVATCPTAALGAEKVRLTLDGHAYVYRRLDRGRCDWSKRYALAGAEGFQYLGSPLDAKPAEGAPVTAAALAEALPGHDPIKKYRPAVCEPCVIHCLYATERAVD